MVPDVRINQYQAEIQPNYFQGSLKGLAGGKSGWFSLLLFIWSFIIPFKNLEACWEKHPVSSYLLPSSRWNKSDTIFSDCVWDSQNRFWLWLLILSHRFSVCLSVGHCYIFIPQLGPGRFQSTLKEPASMYIHLCWSTYQPVQWFRFSAIPYLGMTTSIEVPCTFCGQLFVKVTPSFAKLYLHSRYCEDLSISDLWFTLCLYTISHKEA